VQNPNPKTHDLEEKKHLQKQKKDCVKHFFIRHAVTIAPLHHHQSINQSPNQQKPQQELVQNPNPKIIISAQF
jgi:hypothetical protein